MNASPDPALPANTLPSNALPSNALPSNALPSNTTPENTTALPTSATLPARVSIVVPTRNEAANVEALYLRVRDALGDLAWNLVFVDDSDDQTPAVVERLAGRDTRVRLLHRVAAERRGGLGGAVMHGVHQTTSPVVVVMDGDLQHPPEDVTRLVAQIDAGADLAVASRYTGDGDAGGLSGAFRQAASRGCRAFARVALPRARATTDPLTGFFAFRREVVTGVQLEPRGYKILLEILVKGRWSTLRDVPFTFAERAAGTSKSDIAEAKRFLGHVRALRSGGSAPSSTDVATTGAAMRIMILTSEAPPVVSGISRSMGNLHRSLTARGHEVDLVSRADFPRYMRDEIRLSAFALAWPSFRRRLREYDVVNVHGPVPTISDAFLLLSRTMRRSRRPTVVYTHHSDLAIPGWDRACAVYNALNRQLARLADVVLVSTEGYADQFRNNTRVPTEIIPWGIELPSETLPRVEASEPVLRLVFVGQLRRYKGVHVLLDALAELPAVQLTVIGDGPERPALEAQADRVAPGRVTFLGRVADDVLWQTYAGHDVVVLPSVTSAEAYGLVLAEGMSAGCVPLASDLPGVREVAGPTGLLFPPGDVARLRARIEELAADRGLLETLSTASVARARGLSVESASARHEEVFLAAVRGRLVPVAGRPAGSLSRVG